MLLWRITLFQDEKNVFHLNSFQVHYFSSNRDIYFKNKLHDWLTAIAGDIIYNIAALEVLVLKTVKQIDKNLLLRKSLCFVSILKSLDVIQYEVFVNIESARKSKDFLHEINPFQPNRPAVRIVTRDDGHMYSIFGHSLEEVGQRMQVEETICTLFLSMKAERLIRSLNCDAVYSQLWEDWQACPLLWGKRNRDLDVSQHSMIPFLVFSNIKLPSRL